MVGAICVLVIVGIIIVMMNKAEEKSKIEWEKWRSSEYNLNRSNYAFEKIFETEGSFTTEIMQWLTGDKNLRVSYGTKYKSLKTGELSKITVVVVDGIEQISISGMYFNSNCEAASSAQILIFPRSIIEKDNNPLVVVATDLGLVFDASFFELKHLDYQLLDRGAVKTGFGLEGLDIMRLYSIPNVKDYYVKICQIIEKIAKDVADEYAKKGYVVERRL